MIIKTFMKTIEVNMAVMMINMMAIMMLICMMTKMKIIAPTTIMKMMRAMILNEDDDIPNDGY